MCGTGFIGVAEVSEEEGVLGIITEDALGVFEENC